MAFSMFLRTPAFTSQLLSKQLTKLGTQPALKPVIAQRTLSNATTMLKTEATPILNSFPTFRMLYSNHGHGTSRCCKAFETSGTKNQNKSATKSEKVRSFRTSAVRLSSEKAHDHSKLWVVERITSVLLVPVIPLALIAPNKVFDSVLAILVVAHSFWGLEAIAVDYVRASIFGPVIPKLAIGLVYLISIATLGGLFYIITHDIGVANSIKQFWSIKSGQKA